MVAHCSRNLACTQQAGLQQNSLVAWVIGYFLTLSGDMQGIQLQDIGLQGLCTMILASAHWHGHP